jgi:fumarate reductase subunit D
MRPRWTRIGDVLLLTMVVLLAFAVVHRVGIVEHRQDQHRHATQHKRAAAVVAVKRTL